MIFAVTWLLLLVQTRGCSYFGGYLSLEGCPLSRYKLAVRTGWGAVNGNRAGSELPYYNLPLTGLPFSHLHFIGSMRPVREARGPKVFSLIFPMPIYLPS